MERLRRVHWSLLWAARFVSKWEGLLLHAVLDTIASPPVPTIGYGHTGPDVHLGMVITKARALDLLMHDLRWAARAVREHVKIKLTVRQRIAIISAVFNIGPGLLIDTHFIHALNRGDIHAAANRLLEWDHAGGVVVLGLKRRREAERWMMLHSNR